MQGQGAHSIHVTSSGMWTVSGLAFAPDGRHLVAGCGDRYLITSYERLYVWSWPDEEEVLNERVSGGVWGVAFAPRGDRFVLGTGFGWRACRLAPWEMSPAITQGTGNKAVAVSPDGRLVATAAGWSVVLWDLEARSYRGHLRGHGAPVTSLVFAPDGRTLLSGSWDQSVRVWDVKTHEARAAFDWQRGKVQGVAVAPDGMTAAAACDRGVVVWDVDE